MRHYSILPMSAIQTAGLSKDALKRLSWIDWYFTHGKNAEGTCRHFGISKSVFYRWFNRYNPMREMTTAPEIRKRIYDIRFADKRKSKYEIHEELRREGIMVAHKVIQKVINRHTELQYKRKHKKRMHLKIARIKAARELRDKELGSLVQMDTKYLYVLGHKFYVFAAIDCKSRFAFIYAYTTISSTSGKDFLKRVKAYFPFEIQAVNTDNGSEYLKEFHEELERNWRVPHYFTDPHCPKQNGRVERLQQTTAYEYFDFADVLPSLAEVRTHCMLFNTWYNTKRFHLSLGYQTPMEVVQKSMQQKGGKPFSI